MGLNLPPTMPTGSSGMGSLTPNVGRAGNFGTMKLNQQKEREAASTSISHPGGRSQSASTSVSHPGGSAQTASTSISHPGYDAVQDSEGWDQEGADRRRDNYIRKMVKARQAQEVEDADSANGGGTVLGKGSAFKKKITHRVLRKLMLKGGKGLTASEKKLTEDIITARLKTKKAGSEFTEKDKRSMNLKVYKECATGKVNEGFRRIKRIIGGLE